MKTRRLFVVRGFSLRPRTRPDAAQLQPIPACDIRDAAQAGDVLLPRRWHATADTSCFLSISIGLRRAVVRRLGEPRGPQSGRCARARARCRVRPGLIAAARELLGADLVQEVLVGAEPVSIDSRPTQDTRFSTATTCLNRPKHRLLALVRTGALEFDSQEPRSFFLDLQNQLGALQASMELPILYLELGILTL